jgi:ribosomal subunit interface protein
VDIVVRGRNVEVPDHYRQLVADKLSRLERYDQKLIRIDVELFHERNPRQSQSAQRVEITCKSRGPVVRSEACAADFYSALDNAVNRLQTRFRRVADRRRVHRGRHTPTSVADATGRLIPEQMPGQMDVLGEVDSRNGYARAGVAVLERQLIDGLGDDEGPGRIAREKEHSAEPMSIDQALHNMELVGHDFYLFLCKDTGKPSVVYRRKAFDYGVLRLTDPAQIAGSG